MISVLAGRGRWRGGRLGRREGRPEVVDGIGAPGTPALRERRDPPGVRRAALPDDGVPQRDVAGEEGIGIAEGAHRDVPGGPGADPPDREQAPEGLGAVGTGVELQLARGDGRRDEVQGAPARRRPRERRRVGGGQVDGRREEVGDPALRSRQRGVVAGDQAGGQARFRAAATVIPCPRIARIASSAPSTAPGERRPGTERTRTPSSGSSPSASPTATGSASRSRRRRHRSPARRPRGPPARDGKGEGRRRVLAGRPCIRATLDEGGQRVLGDPSASAGSSVSSRQ